MAPPTTPNLTIAQTTALTRRITWLSVSTASVLSLIKAIGASWISRSVSMLASLADSRPRSGRGPGTAPFRGPLRRRAAGPGAPLRPRQGRGLRQPGPGGPGVRLRRPCGTGGDQPSAAPRADRQRRLGPGGDGRLDRADLRPGAGPRAEVLRTGQFGGGVRRPAALRHRPGLTNLVALVAIGATPCSAGRRSTPSAA